MLPIPLIFIRSGREVRARSHYAQAAQEVIVRMSIVPDLDGVSIMRVADTLATPTTNKEDAQAAQEEEKVAEEMDISSSKMESVDVLGTTEKTDEPAEPEQAGLQELSY